MAAASKWERLRPLRPDTLRLSAVRSGRGREVPPGNGERAGLGWAGAWLLSRRGRREGCVGRDGAAGSGLLGAGAALGAVLGAVLAVQRSG